MARRPITTRQMRLLKESEAQLEGTRIKLQKMLVSLTKRTESLADERLQAEHRDAERIDATKDAIEHLGNAVRSLNHAALVGYLNDR